MRVEGILFSYDTYPTDRGYEAISEVRKVLKDLANIDSSFSLIEPILRPDGVKGLILVDLRHITNDWSEEKHRIVRDNLAEKLSRLMDQGYMLNISKIRILDFIVKTDFNAIVNASKYFTNHIDSSWRITLRTRKLLDRKKLIQEVAKFINAPVDLKNPRYILFIEVIGPTYTILYLVDKNNEEKTIIRF